MGYFNSSCGCRGHKEITLNNILSAISALSTSFNECCEEINCKLDKIENECKDTSNKCDKIYDKVKNKNKNDKILNEENKILTEDSIIPKSISKKSKVSKTK